MESFEKWLNHNRLALDEDAQGLFGDSLKCFKNGIYRPAYLLAYQGMLVTLRSRISNAVKPDGFADAEWIKICNEIKDDNKWDENTYNRVVQQPKPDGSKPAVLSMSDSVRSQFSYWRSMRNVCAHYKDYVFKPAHVLSLYAFIESSLMKISVEGGKEKLLKLFGDYCDPSKYSQSTPLSPLISKIADMVDPKDLEDFIKEAVKIVSNCNQRDPKSFVRDLMFLDGENNEKIRDTTSSMLKSKKELRNMMIDAYPELAPILLDSAVEVREYWSKYLCTSSNRYEVLSALLESGKIPDDEKEEVMHKVLDYGYKWDYTLYGLSGHDKEVLKSSGYFKIFFEDFMTSDKINKYPHYININKKTNFYMSHISCLDIDEDFVNRIIGLFDASLPVPFTLRDRINAEKWQEPRFKQDFMKVVNEKNVNIPNTFLFK